MKKWLYLGPVVVFTAMLAAACNTEPGGKQVGWRAETQSNNPDTLLETSSHTSSHFSAWIGQTLNDVEIAWGEPDQVSGGTVTYKKGREYENMNSETWFEYCEVTLTLGAGEVIQEVRYDGRECRHPLMQYKFQSP